MQPGLVAGKVRDLAAMAREEQDMRRNILLGSSAAAFLGAAIAGSTVLAQSGGNAVTTGGEARYVLEREGEYFVRMDRVTGEMSLCTLVNAELVCRLAADERDALVDEIARLEDQLAGSGDGGKTEGTTERLRDDSTQPKSAERPAMRGDRPGHGDDGRHGHERRSDEEIENEFNQALDFTTRAMRRLFDVMKEFRQELDRQ